MSGEIFWLGGQRSAPRERHADLLLRRAERDYEGLRKIRAPFSPFPSVKQFFGNAKGRALSVLELVIGGVFPGRCRWANEFGTVGAERQMGTAKGAKFREKKAGWLVLMVTRGSTRMG